MNLLRKVPLFANLKDEDRVCIEDTEEWRLSAGEMLFQEGQQSSTADSSKLESERATVYSIPTPSFRSKITKCSKKLPKKHK